MESTWFAERWWRSGVRLPDDAVAVIADAALEEALRLALDWVEGRERGW